MKTFSTALLCLVLGTTAAQQSLKKIKSATASTAVGNHVFYAASDDVHGEELWVSDGTPEGTVMVKDINPGYNQSAPRNMVSFKERLFFTGHTHEHGGELWTSDGTADGTFMVTELQAGPNGSNPHSLVVFKDHLYFTTEQGGLYKSDGTAAGTVLLEKLDYYRPDVLAVGDNYLYYSIYEANQFRRTDGTTVTTIPHPLHDPDDDTYFHSLHAAGNALYAFRTTSYQQEIKLFSYDEANSQWSLMQIVTAPRYGDQEIDNFTAVGNRLFFSMRLDYDNETPVDELWVSNGSITGTQKLTSFVWNRHMSGSAMDHFVMYQDALYFRSSSGGSHALWKSDGTPSGTVKVHDVRITRSNTYVPNPPVVSNGLLWFCGSMDDSGGYGELWNTDGTNTGTKLYADLDPKGGGLPYLFTDADGILYFATGDSYKGTTLWNASPAGEINVSTVYNSQLLSGETLYFSSQESESPCTTRPITIHNSGYKELALSNLLVTGMEFFVKGEIPEFLEPDEKVTVDVYFVPLSPGKKDGEIIICSNDQNEPRYSIKLTGEILSTDYRKVCEYYDGTQVKSLKARASSKSFALSKSVVDEFLPATTLVGLFTVPDFSGPVNYSLTAGKGDEGNAHFAIDGNQLKTNRPFNHSEKNLYSIRVLAATPASSIEETFIISIADRPIPVTSGSCEAVIENFNYGFTDTEFNSSGELFAITNDGRILRSSNEGVNWEYLNSGRWGRLSKIFFKGNTGYITGDYVLLKSDDNGASWFQLYLPFTIAYIDPVTAFFLDDKKGFVTGGGGYFVYTEDGGHSWEIRNEGNTYDAFRNPWFFDENNGLAFQGGTILSSTSDGGRTWKIVDVGTNPHWTSIAFINDKKGFITSAYNTYRTSDGGKTWTGMPEVAGEYLRGIEFKDKNYGYIYGGNYGGLLFVTNDGGESWTSANAYGPGPIAGIARSNGGKLISVHSTDYYYYNGYGRAVNFSMDNGTTWESLHSLLTEDFITINFLTENVGYLLSGTGQYKTVDKGMTWKKLDWSQDIYSVHYFDENNGLLSDWYKIYKTSDGGSTMREVLVTNDNSDPYVPAGELYAVDDQLIFSYSDYALYRSQDGGENWELMNYDFSFTAQDMQFISTTVGYRMELFGGIEKTDDGGTTWEELYTRDWDASDPYTTLFFVDETTGYKAGSKFSKTTDGGVTWNIIYTNFYGDILDVYFSDILHGYVATRHRYLYETFDGGLTWKEIFIGASEYNGLYGIQHKHGNIYLAGTKGYAAQISNPGKIPTQPGYAVGPDIVCVGDSHIYNLAENYTGDYQWNVTSALVNDVGSRAYVQFPHAGEYTMTINSVNQCGVSVPRIQSVTAVSLPAPELVGPELIESLSPPAQYEVGNLGGMLTYAWDATGAKSFTNENSPQSTVMWELLAEQPSIKVLVTDPAAGCRVTESLDVIIDVQLGVEDEASNIVTLYPNPTRGEINIKSRENETVLLTFYSNSGQKYLVQELSPLQASTLRLEHFPAGLYLVEITNNKGKKITKKIVKY